MNSSIGYTKWLIDKLKFKTRENANTNKTSWSSLNIDVQLLILEKLDFVDLLSACQTNKHLYELAVNVFTRKFSKNTIEIKDGPAWHPSDDSDEDTNHFILNIMDILAHFDPFQTEDEFETPPLVTTSNKLVQIQDFELTLLALKYFGRFIEKLKIDYSFMNEFQLNRINGMINEYCSESLIEIHLSNCEGYVLEVFTAPFKKIESVSLGMEMKTVGKSLDQIFPNLKSLSLSLITILDESLIDCHLPYLEHLYFRVEHNFRDTTESYVEILIRNNPQIRSIVLYNVSSRFLAIVNQLLSNLEHLTLWAFAMNGDDIHFENVKTFVMKNALYSSPVNITFSNLEELHMSYYDNRFDAWLDFITKHPNLKRLHIEESVATDIHERFGTLTDNLHSLDEISIVCQGSMSVEAVTKLIGDHENLMKLDLATLTDDVKETLRKELGSRWNIEDFQTSKFQGLSFEKIQ